MKANHGKNQESAQVLRLAQAKVLKCQKVAKSNANQALAAKSKFKNAKKIWKRARKASKRSSKLLKLAEKNLASLTKYVKQGKSSKTPPQKTGRKKVILKPESTKVAAAMSPDTSELPALSS